jgi:hypothetical protein
MSGTPQPFLPASFTGRCLSYRDWAKAAGYAADVLDFGQDFLDSPIRKHWQGSVDFFEREYREGLSVTKGKHVTALIHNWAFDNMEKRQADRYVHLFSSLGDVVARDPIWIDMVVGKCFALEGNQDGAYRFGIDSYPVLKRIADPCFYIGSHRTWGHWICDYLGRLELLDLFPAHRDRTLVLDDLMPFHQEVLDLWEIDKSRVIAIEDAQLTSFSYLFDDLAVASEPPYARAYGYISKKIHDRLALPKGGGPERVYLSRANLTPHHRVENETEIQDLLRARGFEIVFPEQHGITQMAAVLKDAKIVVLPSGSGWANLIFANSGASIIFLKPSLFGPEYRPRLSPFGLRLIDVFRYYEAPFLERIMFLYGRPLNPAVASGFNDNEIFEPRELDQALMMAEKLALFRGR